MEDSGIVGLYFERSERAIQETDKKYGAFLTKVAYNILRDMSDCEEIVNDTYMGAWKAIPPTRPDNFKHFLARITRNLSFDRLDYSHAAKRQAFFVELDECVPDRKNSLENEWDAREIGRVLNEFLGTLDEKNCAVFLGRYFYSCSINELAEQYALSCRQVKYLLSKARKRLRVCLEREGVVL